MTAREILDGLSETLMCDERILSVPERELLTNLLQRAQTNGSTRDNAVAETIARAVGETIAQRAYGILGNSITQRLIEQASAASAVDSGASAIVAHGGAPQPPGIAPQPPKAPQPPIHAPQPPGAAPQPPKAAPQPPIHAPQPPGAAPQPPKAAPQPPIHAPQPPGAAPQPPKAAPQPPRSTASGTQAEGASVAVMERPEFLSAQCVVLEEFLAPDEVKQLMWYTLDHETEFQISEVVSPGVSGGMIDYDHRRSRILMNLDRHHEVIVNRIQACLPRVLAKLGRDVFRPSQVEAQITASNHGDFFRNHSDNLQEDTVSRELTFVYFFHREPKAFRGGDLRIYDSCWQNGQYASAGQHETLVPEQNQIVFFPSSLVHEITPVDCPSQAFADSRFTVNGWFHR